MSNQGIKIKRLDSEEVSVLRSQGVDITYMTGKKY
jgi:hypothetical protein